MGKSHSSAATSDADHVPNGDELEDNHHDDAQSAHEDNENDQDQSGDESGQQSDKEEAVVKKPAAAKTKTSEPKLIKSGAVRKPRGPPKSKTETEKKARHVF